MALEVRTEVPVRWRDLDPLGHMNQAVYHELLEEGRGALLARENRSFPFVIAHVELDYLSEVRKDHGSVVVVTRVERVGRTSVTFAERIERLDGVVAASGRAVLVAWDMKARESRELTSDERASFSG